MQTGRRRRRGSKSQWEKFSFRKPAKERDSLPSDWLSSLDSSVQHSIRTKKLRDERRLSRNKLAVYSCIPHNFSQRKLRGRMIPHAGNKMKTSRFPRFLLKLPPPRLLFRGRSLPPLLRTHVPSYSSSYPEKESSFYFFLSVKFQLQSSLRCQHFKIILRCKRKRKKLFVKRNIGFDQSI